MKHSHKVIWHVVGGAIEHVHMSLADGRYGLCIRFCFQQRPVAVDADVLRYLLKHLLACAIGAHGRIPLRPPIFFIELTGRDALGSDTPQVARAHAVAVNGRRGPS